MILCQSYLAFTFNVHNKYARIFSCTKAIKMFRTYKVVKLSMNDIITQHFHNYTNKL